MSSSDTNAQPGPGDQQFPSGPDAASRGLGDVYKRQCKEIVDTKTRVTNYEACEDMEPRVFHLEKGFLLWEKY